ncbi:MAG: hypothetical protein ABEJ56_02240 [Candidatus Nanohaloarchaea archaeon]
MEFSRLNKKRGAVVKVSSNYDNILEELDPDYEVEKIDEKGGTGARLLRLRDALDQEKNIASIERLDRFETVLPYRVASRQLRNSRKVADSGIF